MTVEIRQKIERAVITALIDEMAKAGFTPVKVWDGGAYVKTTDTAAVLEAVESVDVSTIHFASTTDLEAWGALGVLIVLGNDGTDCLSDWHPGDAAFTAACEATLKRADNLTITC